MSAALPHRRRILAGSGALALVAAVRPSRALEGPAPPRIVAIGGAITEILYRLGLADAIVAVDATSVFPSEALTKKPNVGYMRRLSAEGILSVNPSLVLAIEGAGPPDTLRLVKEAGVPVVMVADEPTEAGVGHRIAAVGAAVGREAQAAALAETVRTGFADLASARRQIGEPKRALFILSLQSGRAMVGGRTTTADGILALAGAENAAASVEGYKPMSDEAIVASRPDVVVMMSVGPSGAPPADLFDGPALAQTPAARGRRLVTMNGLYLLGFGPRTPEAARELMLSVYPGMPKG